MKLNNYVVAIRVKHSSKIVLGQFELTASTQMEAVIDALECAGYDTKKIMVPMRYERYISDLEEFHNIEVACIELSNCESAKHIGINYSVFED